MSTLKEIEDKLIADLSGLSFGPPVTHVYNPLIYAQELHTQFLERFGQGPREVVLLGMNPGPWGMAQTGVPFGEVAAVRDWMGLSGAVGQPEDPHPKRPVEGLSCKRSEVSGRRLWGWAQERFGQPEAFFKDYFVLNYCPLVFMEESGRNFTPDKLPAAERAPLEAACDAALEACLSYFQPRLAIGVGAFAEARLKRVLPKEGGPQLGRILHPSPASPAANRGWAEAAEAQLRALGAPLPVELEAPQQAVAVLVAALAVVPEAVLERQLGQGAEVSLDLRLARVVAVAQALSLFAPIQEVVAGLQRG